MKRRLVLLLVLLLATILRVAACPRLDDAEARLAHLAARIDANDFPGVAPGHPFDGEWKLMTLSWAAVAATNLAMQHPEQRALRAEQLERWARRIVDDDLRAYDTREWGSDALATLGRPDGHAGYLGHVVLTLDAACLLGAKRNAELHQQLVSALARRMTEAPAGLIETYPGEIYVPDNVVVMAALAQYDACVGEPRHAALIASWVATMEARWLDPSNGVLVFAPGQPARGSGASWNSFYLPLVDAAFAAEQSMKFWETFGDRTLFGAFHGIREWPHGDDRGGDVDSGPLIMGISPSATGFALGDARLRGRRDEYLGILRLAELTGVSFGGRYLAAPLVGDAIVLAAKTHAVWKPLNSLSLPQRGETPPTVVEHGGRKALPLPAQRGEGRGEGPARGRLSGQGRGEGPL